MSSILAIDTSTEACSAALMMDDEIIERYQLATKQHGQLILPMIESLFQEKGITSMQLDAIAFGSGPGSFTGLRIAASVTQALAFAYAIPVIAVSTLCAMAYRASVEFKVNNILVGLNAYMQEVYWGAYQLSSDGLITEVVSDSLCVPVKVLMPDKHDWLGVGDAWQIYKSELSQQCDEKRITKIVSDYYPHAADIVKLAHLKFLKGETIKAQHAIPVYLREANAWKKAS